MRPTSLGAAAAGMPSITRTSRLGGNESKAWSEVVDRLALPNTFNPSPLRGPDGRRHLTVRAFGRDRSKPFHAYYATQAADGAPWQLVDLSDVMASSGVDTVADPKLVMLGDAVHATFNTGFDGTRNEVYLVQLWPHLGHPQRCVLADRQPVEKNWGFFFHGGQLHCLYSLDPLVVLTVTGAPGGASGDLHWVRTAHEPAPAGRSRWSIGPQPVEVDGDLLLIAHEKWYVRGRRGYVGRPITVAGIGTGRPVVRPSRRRLIHSWRSLVPTRERHNPNLLFATYFSGMYRDGEQIIIGSGVNDLSSAFAQCAWEDLWV